jgi:hypothetical protein
MPNQLGTAGKLSETSTENERERNEQLHRRERTTKNEHLLSLWWRTVQDRRGAWAQSRTCNQEPTHGTAALPAVPGSDELEQSRDGRNNTGKRAAQKSAENRIKSTQTTPKFCTDQIQHAISKKLPKLRKNQIVDEHEKKEKMKNTRNENHSFIRRIPEGTRKIWASISTPNLSTNTTKNSANF